MNTLAALPRDRCGILMPHVHVSFDTYMVIAAVTSSRFPCQPWRMSSFKIYKILHVAITLSHHQPGLARIYKITSGFEVGRGSCGTLWHTELTRIELRDPEITDHRSVSSYVRKLDRFLMGQTTRELTAGSSRIIRHDSEVFGSQSKVFADMP